MFSCRRIERNSMKTELPALVGQREKNMSWGERESRYRPWIFFLVFCCSSNVLIRWFRVHGCTSGMRILFGVNPKMKLVFFASLYISLADVQLLVLPHRISQSTNFQPRVVPLFPPGVVRRNQSVSSGSTPAQNTLDLCFFFFLVIFLITVVIHPWLAALQQVLWPESREVSLAFRRLTV